MSFHPKDSDKRDLAFLSDRQQRARAAKLAKRDRDMHDEAAAIRRQHQLTLTLTEEEPCSNG